MAELPVLRYTCKHTDSKKVINREFHGAEIITSIDLCKECVNDLVFSGQKENFKDTKITRRSRNKPLNATQLKKAIKKRQDEIKILDEEIRKIWHESDKLERIGKLLERYIEICQLYKDLELLNEKLFQKQKVR